MHASSSKGFSLVETVVALGVLITGVLGAAAVLASGMQNLGTSPADVIITQKAAEAIEAVFSARQSGKLTWTQLKNKSNGGIFLDGQQPLNRAGADGIVDTDDDTTAVSTTVCPVVCWGVETMTLPGPDQQLNTADDRVTTLSNYQRQIVITDVAGENGQLRSIEVTIYYVNGSRSSKYVITTYISAYS
jgi:type II secretory pathway pseudopilin PulG